MSKPQESPLWEDENIDLCVNYIEEGECILFLGPQFALDEEGKKIHEQLRGHIQSDSFKDKIDFTYDNLFIFKDTTPTTADKMRLTMALKKKYKQTTPHPIYKKIPAIPFSAIISCSPDQFLKDAFEAQGFDLYFRYYSRKGEGEDKGIIDEEETFLYNVFGYIGDENSLITTYESFYKFIISIMGEEQQLPLELRNRIVNAKVYMFMGFDLTKWYIPLLIHKLNSFKQDSEGNDVTAMISGDNTRNEETGKHFPIEMMVLNGDAIPTIDVISQRLDENGSLRAQDAEPLNCDVEVFKEKVADNVLDGVFEDLLKCFDRKGFETNGLILLQNRFNELEKNQNGGVISETDAKLERNRIVTALLDFIDKLNA